MAFLAAIFAAASTLLAPPFKATLVSSTHAPKINVHWWYEVRATSDAGRPLAARLTVQIVDPVGGVHPVQFGTSTKNLTDWPFTGRFRDFIDWPPDSRGFPLRLRVTVVADGAKRVLTYQLTPK